MIAIFFLLARMLRVAFVALQALAGIIVLSHGIKRFVTT